MDTPGEPILQNAFEVREGIEMVPGTVHLVDMQGTSVLKHRIGNNADIVLVPQPTSDPDDPLNWSPLRKGYHFWLLIIWGVLMSASVNWSGPVWVVAAGYITEAQGWRFCFWYLVIFFGIILVLQIFTLEESIYRRPLADPEPQYELNNDASNDSALTGKNPNPLIAQPIRRDTVTAVSAFPIPAQTYWQKMAPIHTRNANPKKWWWLAIFPFRLLTFPAIMWVGIMVGIQIMWLSLLSVTQSELFSAPPYSFGIAAVGDTNIAAFVGGIFGMCWGGPLSDWYILRRSRQNKGIMEPEFRLWLLIVPAILNSAGLLMYGLGAYNGLSWVISAGIGTAFIGFGIGSGGAICLTYAIDAYPGIAAESMVLILFIRNVIGFSFTFAIQRPRRPSNGHHAISTVSSVHDEFLDYEQRAKEA
ncbi:uncharacterized protein K444DRAFT_628128 [Hyaloscypha bicolor E]|uniref:MFS general substrate transporter n=1 Tax=Hyaloscypha bicolor E TaxID=1095630 RepID=A0A2J6TGI9_9HELO|nr:uncharacterized protein K444DRAFT_628128 [Hyaloscypha bicolor E]PMD62130.1 hypothetical protein K444DRAFT_628128 [Hyaloscypha bicolor E]